MHRIGIKYFTKKIKNKWEDHTAYCCELVGRDGELYREAVIGDISSATRFLGDWIESHPQLDYARPTEEDFEDVDEC